MKSPNFGLFVLFLFPLLSSTLLGQVLRKTLENEAGSLRFNLYLEAGVLSYGVTQVEAGRETLVVERSPLGLQRRDGDFAKGLSFAGESPVRRFSETYTLAAGKRHEVSYSAVEVTYRFTNAQGKGLDLQVRAQADGLAFRYSFPDTSGGEFWLTNDETGFQMPEDGRVWLQPYEKIATWSPAYEMEYQNGIPVGSETPQGDYRGWALPALFKVKDRWVLLTEANVDGSSYVVHLQPKCEKGLYRVRLPEPEETYGVAPVEARFTGTWFSPWRVFVVGTSLATIVETTLVYDLSSPCVVEDTSWIRPGRATWSWWSDTSSASDYNRLVPFVDYASDQGWEYSTIDLGWPWMRNGDIHQLIAYAAKRKVGLLLWYNSGGKHNQVPDAGPRDCMDTPEQIEAELSKIAAWGIKGIKVDFFQSDKQYVLQKYIDILRIAAKHRILVDFHGATIPRGWARTYPNLMTSEGVRGAEQYWDAGFAERAHSIHTIYAFTRNVLGSMDYTPLVIGGAPHLQWHQTTNAHELATLVAFESGIQHIAASVNALRCQPDFVQAYLKAVPADWDETRYLAGEPGDLAVLARRKGKQWWMAALNGRAEARTLTLPLAFLGAGEFAAEQISDGSWQKECSYRSFKVRATETLELKLASRGGAVFHLSP